MATLLTTADGNLTGGSTFAASETGTSALAMIRNTTATLATAASVTSPTFTVTNAKVIDGAHLWLYLSSGTAGTGTLKVDLQKGGVSQASVTVNKSDLPDANNTQPVPVFFKFTGTATGDGGTNWTLVLTSTSGTGSGVVTYQKNSATTGDFTRALRTTTTATPAAGDNLIVVGELTGAGTHNSRTVTMDSTVATAYGNNTVNSATVYGGLLAIGQYGTMSYGTSASTNYVLRLAGDLLLFQSGTFNMGSSGAEIPRTSTAVLEFQQVSASGDFGFVNRGGTRNIAGLSRTSGKTVTQTKLTADVTSSNVLTSGTTTTNGSVTANNAVDPTNVSLLASTFNDTATNATHSVAYTGPSVTNTTQTAQVWLARGTGTNNRFVRLTAGNNTVFSSVTNGFFADVDLQAGTIGTCTAIGNGTATSSSIVAVGGGFLCTITGKVSSGAATPSVLVNACSAAGTTSFAGAANQCWAYEGLQLVTAASIGSTTISVAADTGWLSGDSVVVAPSNNSQLDIETFVLNANAGSNSFTTALYPLGYGGPTTHTTGTVHSGSSPVQAEVGLLTRNVKVRSTSATLMTYVYSTALSVENISWAEFYYVGTSVTNKRGVEIDGGASCGAKSITYCSIHDCGSNGLYCNATAVTSLNLTFSNNVLFKNSTSSLMLISGTIVNTDWTFDSNLVALASGDGASLGDVGGVFTNNTVVCNPSSFNAIKLLDSATIGTFSGNTAHSSATGLAINVSGLITGTIDNFTSWRNGSNSNDITINAGSTVGLVFYNPNLFGTGTNIFMTGGDSLTITGSGIMAGDTSFPSATGISIQCPNVVILNVTGVDMSGTTSIYAAHTTQDFNISGAVQIAIRGVVKNSKFGAPSLIASKSTWDAGSYVEFPKYNNTSGDHRTEMTYGQIKSDTAIFGIASPSMRMTPNSASSKLPSSPVGQGLQVAVNSGDTVTVSASIRESVSGDGAAYNGNAPRIVVRANPSVGISSDTVVATYSGAAGSFQTVSGTTAAANDDGVMEFYFDCDGTAGWANVDDVTFT